MLGLRDPLLEFRDPLKSRESLNLETSNLALRMITMCINYAVTGSFFIPVKHCKLKFYLECHIHFVP